MPKPQKVEAVKELKERFESADAALLAEYRGLKVQEMKEVRRTLASGGTDLKVVKNTLSKIAATEANLSDLLPLLQGSTAIAFIQGDPVAAAKGMDEMAKKYPALVIKGGLLDGKVFGPDEAKALAKVEPREVLLAKLAGLLQAPLQSVANLLTAPVRQLGYVLGAYQEMRQKDAPEEPVPEAAAETPADVPEQSAEESRETGPSEATTSSGKGETESEPQVSEKDPDGELRPPQGSDESSDVVPEPPPAASEAVADTGEEAAPTETEGSGDEAEGSAPSTVNPTAEGSDAPEGSQGTDNTNDNES